MADRVFPTNYEEIFTEMKACITREVHDDQIFVEKILKKLDKSIVLSPDQSSYLYYGYVRKLNKDDYSLTVKKENGEYFVPASFVKEQLSGPSDIDDRKYLPLKTYAEKAGRTVEIYSAENIIILSDGNSGFGGEEFREERERLFRFFIDPLIPQPRINVEQTRKVIGESVYPADSVDWRNTEYVTLYSPAITVMYLNGEKNIFAAHEYSRLKNWKELETVTVLKKSSDDGRSWTVVSEISHMRWASLFVHKGRLYLSGTNIHNDYVMYVRFNEDVSSFEIAEFDFNSGETAPNTILEAYGRIYQALGKAVISADADSDLLNFDSWTVSSKTTDILTKEWFLKASGEPDARRFKTLEGNIVLGKDGNIYNILRCETQPASGYAAILQVGKDGKEVYKVDSCDSLIHMPTSVSKFVIRFDEKSQKYISLTSINTVKGFGDQRSVLAMVSSDNLLEWKINEYLLVDREIMNPVCSAYKHAFQYVDFVIDGDDIIMLVREAIGRTNIWHDGSHITFYRIDDFRSYL